MVCFVSISDHAGGGGGGGGEGGSTTVASMHLPLA